MTSRLRALAPAALTARPKFIACREREQVRQALQFEREWLGSLQLAIHAGPRLAVSAELPLPGARLTSTNSAAPTCAHLSCVRLRELQKRACDRATPCQCSTATDTLEGECLQYVTIAESRKVESMSGPEYLSIGEVASELGETLDTVRHWEKFFRLRVSRTRSGHRIFTRADVERLRRIRELVCIDGLSLEAARVALRNRRKVAA